MMRTLTAAVLALVLGAGTTAASPPAPPLRIALASEPGTLDPLLLTGPPAATVGALFYSYLVRVDAAGALVPDLAARVPSRANGDISSDGRTILYRLRSGIRWSDGAAFSAADVIATYRAILDPRNPVPTRLGFDRVVSIDAPGPHTLRVRLRQPFAPFLTYFFEPENYPVLPAHILARAPVLAESTLATQPVGTGPYLLERWRREESLRVRANPEAFAGAPGVERIDLRFVPSAQTVVQQLRTGELDGALAVDPGFIGQLRDNPRVAVVVAPVFGFEALSFQTTDPALRDPRIRRRIAASFNIPRAIERATQGVLMAGAAGRGLFTWSYRRQPPMRAETVAPPTHLTLAIDASRPSDRAVAIALQDDARRAGIALEILPYATQLFFAPPSDRGPLTGGRYQLALHAVLTGADPETAWLLACDQRPPGGFNVSRYCNPAVDAALADGLLATDRRRRIHDYERVQAAIARDVPFVAAWQLREVEALPRGLRGFSPNPETPFASVGRWRFTKITM